MGSCCACCSQHKGAYAYRTEVGSTLLKELLPKLPVKQTKVIVIRLKSISDLEPISRNSRVNPYVEMKLMPADSFAGELLQRSSEKADTLSPKWEPDERFQFFLSDEKPSDILLSVYSFNGGKEPVALGDGVIKSKDVTNTEAMEKTVKLVNPKNGRPCGQVQIQIQLKTVKQALSCEEHTVYQYQRWSPAEGWGQHHLLPTDPGSWSSVDGAIFGREMEVVIPKMTAGWVVEKQWYALANELDHEGWQYAMDFNSNYWYAKEGSGMYVRRRAWRREVCAPDAVQKPAVSASSSALNPLNSRKSTGTTSVNGSTAGRSTDSGNVRRRGRRNNADD